MIRFAFYAVLAGLAVSGFGAGMATAFGHWASAIVLTATAALNAVLAHSTARLIKPLEFTVTIGHLHGESDFDSAAAAAMHVGNNRPPVVAAPKTGGYL